MHGSMNIKFNYYMFRRRGAILRESQRQKNTSTNTSIWEVQCIVLHRCIGACIPLSLRLPEDVAVT